MPEIKLSSEQLSLMSLFQSMSGATAVDCIIDEKLHRVIFLVAPGQMGLAIGKDGASVKKVERAVKTPVEVVEYSDDMAQLAKNALGARYVQEVRMEERMDGLKGVVIVVDAKKKGAVVGAGGRNAEKVRMLLKRHFGVASVQIISPF